MCSGSSPLSGSIVLCVVDLHHSVAPLCHVYCISTTQWLHCAMCSGSSPLSGSIVSCVMHLHHSVAPLCYVLARPDHIYAMFKQLYLRYHDYECMHVHVPVYISEHSVCNGLSIMKCPYLQSECSLVSIEQ